MSDEGWGRVSMPWQKLGTVSCVKQLEVWLCMALNMHIVPSTRHDKDFNP